MIEWIKHQINSPLCLCLLFKILYNMKSSKDGLFKNIPFTVLETVGFNLFPFQRKYSEFGGLHNKWGDLHCIIPIAYLAPSTGRYVKSSKKGEKTPWYPVCKN